jgi:hypothetical protein
MPYCQSSCNEIEPIGLIECGWRKRYNVVDIGDFFCPNIFYKEYIKSIN